MPQLFFCVFGSIVRMCLSCLVDLNSDFNRLFGSLHGPDTMAGWEPPRKRNLQFESSRFKKRSLLHFSISHLVRELISFVGVPWRATADLVRGRVVTIFIAHTLRNKSSQISTNHLCIRWCIFCQGAHLERGGASTRQRSQRATTFSPSFLCHLFHRVYFFMRQCAGNNISYKMLTSWCMYANCKMHSLFLKPTRTIHNCFWLLAHCKQLICAQSAQRANSTTTHLYVGVCSPR